MRIRHALDERIVRQAVAAVRQDVPAVARQGSGARDQGMAAVGSIQDDQGRMLAMFDISKFDGPDVRGA